MSAQRNKLLAYILHFAREEGLEDLEELLVESYPRTQESTGLNIPFQALYQAVDAFETTREQEVTKDVRALIKYYEEVLTLDDSTSSQLPHDTAVYTAANCETFPLTANALSTSSHPAFPNILLITTAAKELFVVFVPSHSSTHPNQGPTVIGKLDGLPTPALCATPVLVRDFADASRCSLLINLGCLDGRVLVARLDGITNTTTSQTPGLGPFSLTMLPFRSSATVGATDFKPHAKYVVKILAPVNVITPTSALDADSLVYRLITCSHDQSVASVQVGVTAIPSVSDSQDEPVVKLFAVDFVETAKHGFSGKIEAACFLPVPTVTKRGIHPVVKTPTLIPTKHHTRHFTSQIRKLHKGNYLDNVEFITNGIPFDVSTGAVNLEVTATASDATQTAVTSPSADISAVNSPFIAVSVRNDVHIYILNSITLDTIDTINVNITGDTHVSFTVLDLAFDAENALLYLATDAHTVLMIDVMTKQHIRRFYCTDNHDMSSPILALLSLRQDPSLVAETSEGETPPVHHETRLVVAITTSTNAVKLYNPHTQEELGQLSGHTKNVKGFVLIPNENQLGYNLVSTGFDKSLVIHY